MRTIEEIKADLRQAYEHVHVMFECWQTGMHEQFMVAMWSVYDLRQELVGLTGSREEAQRIVRDVYLSVFRNNSNQDKTP